MSFPALGSQIFPSQRKQDFFKQQQQQQQPSSGLYEVQNNPDKILKVINVDPSSLEHALIEAVISNQLKHRNLVSSDQVFYSDHVLGLERKKGIPISDSSSIPSSWSILKERLLGLLCAVEDLHNRNLADIEMDPSDLVLLRDMNQDRLALADFASTITLRPSQEEKMQDLKELVETLLELIAMSVIQWLQKDNPGYGGIVSHQSDLKEAFLALQRLGDLLGQTVNMEQIRTALGPSGSYSCEGIEIVQPLVSNLLSSSQSHGMELAQELARASGIEALNRLLQSFPSSSSSSFQPPFSPFPFEQVSPSVSSFRTMPSCPPQSCVPRNSIKSPSQIQNA